MFVHQNLHSILTPLATLNCSIKSESLCGQEMYETLVLRIVILFKDSVD